MYWDRNVLTLIFTRLHGVTNQKTAIYKGNVVIISYIQQLCYFTIQQSGGLLLWCWSRVSSAGIVTGLQAGRQWNISSTPDRRDVSLRQASRRDLGATQPLTELVKYLGLFPLQFCSRGDHSSACSAERMDLCLHALCPLRTYTRGKVLHIWLP